MPGATLENLITSAVVVFSQKTFRDATVAEICQHARANIAAISYHFGSKQELFITALKRAFEVAEKTYPIRGFSPHSQPPSEAIATFSRALLRRSFDPGPPGDFNRIMSLNIHASGSPVSSILIEVRKLELDYLDDLVRRELPAADPESRAQARFNIINSAVIFTMNPFMVKEIHPDSPSPAQIDELIETQVQLISAGLASLASSPTLAPL